MGWDRDNNYNCPTIKSKQIALGTKKLPEIIITITIQVSKYLRQDSKQLPRESKRMAYASKH